VWETVGVATTGSDLSIGCFWGPDSRFRCGVLVDGKDTLPSTTSCCEKVSDGVTFLVLDLFFFFGLVDTVVVVPAPKAVEVGFSSTIWCTASKIAKEADVISINKGFFA